MNKHIPWALTTPRWAEHCPITQFDPAALAFGKFLECFLKLHCLYILLVQADNCT